MGSDRGGGSGTPLTPEDAALCAAPSLVERIKEEARTRREASGGAACCQPERRAAILTAARQRRVERRKSGLVQRAGTGGALRRTGTSRSASTAQQAECTTVASAETGSELAEGSDSESSSECSGDLALDSEDWEARWEEDESTLDHYLSILAHDRVLDEVAQKGSNLRAYVAEKEKALRAKEDAAIEATIACTGGYADLYCRLSQAEDLLGCISGKVGGFVTHLKGRTEEISSLQARSTAMIEQKAARSSASLYLEPVLRKMDGVTDEWFREINSLQVEVPDGPRKLERQRDLDHYFLSELRKLDDRLNYLEEDPVLANSQLKKALFPRMRGAAERLCPRVAEFLGAKLRELRDTSNIKIRQQAIAHRSSFAFRMLRSRNPSAALELMSEYADVMGKVYARNLRRLHESVSRGDAKTAKAELIVPKGMFDTKKGTEAQGKVAVLQKALGGAKRIVQGEGVTVPFNDRITALRAVVPSEDQLIVDPSVLQPDCPRCGPETFLQLMAGFVNASVQEASFVAEFFGLKEKTREEMLCSIFKGTHSFVREKASEALAQGCGDLVGCLVLLRLSESLFSFLLPTAPPAATSPITAPSSVPPTPSCRTLASPEALSAVASDDCVSEAPSLTPRPSLGGQLTRQESSVPASPAMSQLGDTAPSEAPTVTTTHGLITSRARRDDTAGAGIAKRSAQRKYRTQKELVSLLKDLQTKLYLTWQDLVEEQLATLRQAGQLRFAKFAPSAAGSVSRQAHPCVRRYTALAGELHALNTLPIKGSRVEAGTQAYFSDAVVADLSAMRRALLSLLAAFADRFTSPSTRSVFLMNSYAELAQAGLPGAEEAEGLLNQEVSSLVSAQLRNSALCPVVEFCARVNEGTLPRPVPQCEADFDANRESAGCTAAEGGAAAAAVSSYAASWQSAMSVASSSFGQSFERATAGRRATVAFFTSVAELSDSLRRTAFLLWAEPPFQTRLVPTEVVRHEALTAYSVTL